MASLLDGFLGTSMDDPRTMGLLALAGGMVRGDLGGGLLGYGQAYQGAQDASLKRQIAQQGMEKGAMELDLMRQQVARTNAIRDALAQAQSQGGLNAPGAAVTSQPQQAQFNTPTIAGIPMFSQGTSVVPQTAPQSGTAQPPQAGISRGVSTRLLQQADIYAKYGDFENANKLYEQAAKFIPEVKEMGVLMQGNRPVNVITYKDGTQQVTDLAPKPDVHWLDTGNAVTPVNQLTMQPMASPVKKSATPDAMLADARERSQFAQTNRREYITAGFNPDGTPAGDMELTAQAIANGQLPPPSGMALTNPRNQRILSRVMEINPNYDYTTTMAKKKAAADFATGQQGNAIRSFATAGEHLDQLNTLVDAMNNGNVQLVNKVANVVGAQTGNVAPTNFDAAKDIVAKEVMKAIVAGGGGVGEREELQRTMDNAKSPAQLKGVIQQYRNLMSAQYGNLLAQRRAAGLPDSTLPKYNFGAVSPEAGEPSATSGWTYLGTMK